MAEDVSERTEVVRGAIADLFSAGITERKSDLADRALIKP
jgi:hypothetical protein